MRSAEECRRKAAEMRLRALEDGASDISLQWLLMAREWRELALQAERQDRWLPAA